MGQFTTGEGGRERARTFQRGSSSKSCAALEKRVLARTSLLSSSIAVKPSRAARSAARFSATSSRLRCSTYSLKQAFFSPSDFSAEYL